MVLGSQGQGATWNLASRTVSQRTQTKNGKNMAFLIGENKPRALGFRLLQSLVFSQFPLFRLETNNLLLRRRKFPLPHKLRKKSSLKISEWCERIVGPQLRQN